jgi:beta-glucosidase
LPFPFLTNTVQQLHRGVTVLNFPQGFLWGAATAAHQVEGNNVHNDWWVKEHARGTQIVEPSGDAIDSYHRFGEDMKLLADAGLDTYRFSIEWSRIEPAPDSVSRAEIDHYRRMVDTARENGLNPVVTLMHFTVPQWMFERGFWRNPDAPDLFARFTELALPILAEGVDYVCTINEPNIAAMLAGGETAANLVAFGLPRPDLQVADALLESHKRAREVLSSVRGLKSGWTVATQAFQSTGEPGAEEKLREYGYPSDDWYLENARGDDFIGVQAYTRTFIGPDGPVPVRDDVETTLTGWEFYPPALGLGVRAAWELSGHVPVMVTENGIATADDTRRIAYTDGALRGLHSAMDDGVEVLGYLHWSALDNYEWASGFRPTFGLIAVDRETFVRTPKPSLAWLGEIATRNGLADEPTEPAAVDSAA